MIEKKVLLFIVEGESDSDSLSSILKKYFSNDKLRFHIVKGDITADWNNNTGNIEKKIEEEINIELLRSKLLLTDISKIIHIVDTDGVYIPDSSIIENKKADKDFIYTLDKIEFKNVQQVINRNNGKKAILNLLSTLPFLKCSEGKDELKIPYSIYYLSRNLEHVLHNKFEELEKEAKKELAFEFAEKYENDIDSFIKLISSDDIAVTGSYNETWDFIKVDLNSLNRFNNFHLIFSETVTV